MNSVLPQEAQAGEVGTSCSISTTPQVNKDKLRICMERQREVSNRRKATY